MGVQSEIEFVTKSCEFNIKNINKKLEFAVTLYCPDPYFKDDKGFSKNIAGTLPLLTSPFAIPIGKTVTFSAKVKRRFVTIENDGDREAGILVKIIANGDVHGPVLENQTTNEYMRVEASMKKGDVMIIDTRRGKKRIELNGANINNKFVRDGKYLQMALGENIIAHHALNGDNNMDVYLTFEPEYLGV